MKGQRERIDSGISMSSTTAPSSSLGSSISGSSSNHYSQRQILSNNIIFELPVTTSHGREWDGRTSSAVLREDKPRQLKKAHPSQRDPHSSSVWPTSRLSSPSLFEPSSSGSSHCYGRAGGEKSQAGYIAPPLRYMSPQPTSQKELPPLPLDINTMKKSSSKPILPRLQLGGPELDVPPSLLSPLPYLIAGADAMPKATHSPVIQSPLLPASAQSHTPRSSPKNNRTSLTRNGPVSSAECKRMTQLWVSMLEAGGGLLGPSSSSLSIPAMSSGPAGANLSVPGSNAASPAPSSDCCDPSVLNRQQCHQGHRECESGTNKSSAASTLAVPTPKAPQRRSLNPFEIDFMATSGGFLMPLAEAQSPSPSPSENSASLQQPSSLSQSQRPSLPLLQSHESSSSCASMASGSAADLASEAGRLAARIVNAAHRPTKPARAYHSRFKSQQALYTSAREAAGCHDNDVTPRVRQESFASDVARSSASFSSSVRSADLSESIIDGLSQSLLLSDQTVSDSSISSPASSVLSASAQPHKDAFASFLAEVESRFDDKHKSIESRDFVQQVHGYSIGLSGKQRVNSTYSTRGAKEKSRRQSTIEIVMYGVAL